MVVMVGGGTTTFPLYVINIKSKYLIQYIYDQKKYIWVSQFLVIIRAELTILNFIKEVFSCKHTLVFSFLTQRALHGQSFQTPCTPNQGSVSLPPQNLTQIVGHKA